MNLNRGVSGSLWLKMLLTRTHASAELSNTLGEFFSFSPPSMLDILSQAFKPQVLSKALKASHWR